MSAEPRTPAHAYQDYFGPAIFAPLSRHVVESAAPQRGEHVLDVACGTGIVTRAVAERVGPTGRVVGVDVNPAMIAVAAAHPFSTTAIEWREEDATSLDLPDGSFQLVCCQQGLQFFPDRAAGAAEMRRVADEGGRAVVAVWQDVDAHPLFAALADAEEPHLGALGVAVDRDELIAPFSFGDADALRDLLAGAGFADVELTARTIEARFPDADHFVERVEYAYAAVVPAFAADTDAFADYLAAIAHDTRVIVDEHRDGDHVVVPMHANIAVART